MEKSEIILSFSPKNKKMFQHNKLSILFILLMMSDLSAFSQPSMPFNRGINLTNWFQVNDISQIQFNKYTKTDFEQIKFLGVDVIRLPIHLHTQTTGSPDFKVDPILFNFLDQIVTWCEELGLHIIFDNHTFDASGITPPDIEIPLLKIWPQIAARYKSAYKNIYYEILNEPNGISDASWNKIQLNVINAIRKTDQSHTIIIGPANWNNYQNLKAMPIYDDKNLIYTFHFYEPFLFTHQGASWTTPSMAALKNVPFPFALNTMPGLPTNLKGTWVESAFNGYYKVGNIDFIIEQIAIATKFAKDRNVPIFCGEFGVNSNGSNNTDRVKWYEMVRKELENQKIPWTIWDYHGSFGLFQPGSQGLFNHHLNIPLLQSLGFVVPPQSVYEKKPIEGEKWLYRDELATDLRESSYGAGKINYYFTDQPSDGKYAIQWKNPKQYDIIGWKFSPEVDLSLMVQQNYLLSLYVKGNIFGKSIDIRFLDSKTGADDRPWRMAYRLDEKTVKWDNSWQLIQIPLFRFSEQGAWDENAWFQPSGKFDWKSIDRFEIVAESNDLQSGILYFDDVRLKPASPSFSSSLSNQLTFSLFPNPASDELNVYLESNENDLHYKILDIIGVEKKSGIIDKKASIKIDDLENGSYILVVYTKNGNQTSKTFIVLK